MEGGLVPPDEPPARNPIEIIVRPNPPETTVPLSWYQIGQLAFLLLGFAGLYALRRRTAWRARPLGERDPAFARNVRIDTALWWTLMGALWPWLILGALDIDLPLALDAACLAVGAAAVIIYLVISLRWMRRADAEMRAVQDHAEAYLRSRGDGAP